MCQRQFWSTLPGWVRRDIWPLMSSPAHPTVQKTRHFWPAFPTTFPRLWNPSSLLTLNSECWKQLWVLQKYRQTRPEREAFFPVRSHLTIRKLNHSSSSAHPDGPKHCILKVMTQFCVKQDYDTKAFEFTFQRHECKNHCLNAVPSAAESRPPI